MLRSIPRHLFNAVERLVGLRAARYIRAALRPITIRAVSAAWAVPHCFGFHVSRYKAGHLGVDFRSDTRLLLSGIARPVVFDVGANIGQSVMRFKGLLPRCEIHSFEPSPTAFDDLVANTRGVRSLYTVQAAVGATRGTTILLENDQSELTSLLRPTASAWGKVVRETPVPLVTIDTYCTGRRIDHIDLLKIDTQGNDLEVLKGAEGLIASARIRTILIEVIFAEFYEGAPAFDEVFRFLSARRFRLVGFYDWQTYHNMMRWTDLLFVHQDWAERARL